MVKFYLFHLMISSPIVLSSICDCVRFDDEPLRLSQWNLWFERLFGNRQHPMDGPSIIRALMRLHKGSDQTIERYRAEMVEFWYDANVRKPEQCTTRFLAEMSAERTRYLDKKHYKDVIYEFTRRRVMSNCYRMFIDELKELAALTIKEQENLLKLGVLWIRMRKHHMSEEAKWDLGNLMGKLVGPVNRKSERDFIAAWRNGICSKLFSQLKRPEMTTFVNIGEFLATFDYEQREENSAKANRWVTAIQACKNFRSDGALSSIWRYVQEA